MISKQDQGVLIIILSVILSSWSLLASVDEIESFSFLDLHTGGLLLRFEGNPEEAFYIPPREPLTKEELTTSKELSYKFYILRVPEAPTSFEEMPKLGLVDLTYHAKGQRFENESQSLEISRAALELNRIFIGDFQKNFAWEEELTNLVARRGDFRKPSRPGLGTRMMKLIFFLQREFFPNETTLCLECVKAEHRYQSDFRRKWYGKKLGMREVDLGERYGSKKAEAYTHFFYQARRQETPFEAELNGNLLLIKNTEGETKVFKPLFWEEDSSDKEGFPEAEGCVCTIQ